MILQLWGLLPLSAEVVVNKTTVDQSVPFYSRCEIPHSGNIPIFINGTMCYSWFIKRDSLTARHPKQPCQDIGGGVFSKEGTLTLKLVNVLEIDMQFSDIAEIFNKQHRDHWAMKEAIQKLKEISGCAPRSSLAACIENIKQEHGAYNVQVLMKGYRFSLIAEEKELPHKLKQAQQQVEELNRATKHIVATEIKLQEMARSVLQNQSQLVERVKSANPEYLDQVRLEANVTENFQKVSLATECSKQYGEDASSVLKEMAQSAGLTL